MVEETRLARGGVEVVGVQEGEVGGDSKGRTKEVRMECLDHGGESVVGDVVLQEMAATPVFLDGDDEVTLLAKLTVIKAVLRRWCCLLPRRRRPR